jgi:hypothetical protein
MFSTTSSIGRDGLKKLDKAIRVAARIHLFIWLFLRPVLYSQTYRPDSTMEIKTDGKTDATVEMRPGDPVRHAIVHTEDELKAPGRDSFFES